MSTTLRGFAFLGVDDVSGGTGGSGVLWSPPVYQARSLARRWLRELVAFCDDPRHAVRARLCQLEREAAARARPFGGGATDADEELSARLSGSMAVLLRGLDSGEAAGVVARWLASPHGCCRRAAEIVLATGMETSAPDRGLAPEGPPERQDRSVVMAERRRRKTGQVASRAPDPDRRPPAPAMRGRSSFGTVAATRASGRPARGVGRRAR